MLRPKTKLVLYKYKHYYDVNFVVGENALSSRRLLRAQ